VSDLDRRRAGIFGSYAEDYDQWRPGYPDEAVEWLVPPGASRVADVGAGTGKLTGSLLARGLQVAAVEPDAAMLAVLRRQHPAAEAYLAGAEALPLPDASVDAVVAGQAWHWFPHEAAIAQVRRVLRPGGWLGLVWNGADPREPWEVELAQLHPDTPPPDRGRDSREPVVPGLAGADVEWATFAWTNPITPAHMRAQQATHSALAVMPAAERESRLDAMAAAVAAEARRLGTTTVPLHMQSVCVRWRP
jgi:SAM-dependent methyltransferase